MAPLDMTPPKPVEPGDLLLVDDDVVLRERLAKALRARGFEVRTAGGYDEAVALASYRAPDYAVVDLRMPGRSGLELVQALHEEDSGTRILVLSGYGSISTAVEAVGSGPSTSSPSRLTRTTSSRPSSVGTALRRGSAPRTTVLLPSHVLSGSTSSASFGTAAGTSPRPLAGSASTAARCSGNCSVTRRGTEPSIRLRESGIHARGPSPPTPEAERERPGSPWEPGLSP